MLCYEPCYIIKRADLGAEIGHLDFRLLSAVWIEFSGKYPGQTSYTNTVTLAF